VLALERGGARSREVLALERGGTLLEGGVSPRAGRNLLEGTFDWASPMGRGDHRNMGCAVCARLGKRCVLFCFFAGFKQGSPGFLGDPQGCPRHSGQLVN
jgi:hypothetical protein